MNVDIMNLPQIKSLQRMGYEILERSIPNMIIVVLHNVESGVFASTRVTFEELFYSNNVVEDVVERMNQYILKHV